MEEQSNPISEAKWITRLKDAIAILGGLSAIAVAFLWYLGRRFMDGYYGALHVPIDQVTLSLWDYTDAGWSILIFLVLFVSIFSSLAFSSLNSGKVQKYAQAAIFQNKKTPVNPKIMAGVFAVIFGIMFYFQQGKEDTIYLALAIFVMIAVMITNLPVLRFVVAGIVVFSFVYFIGKTSSNSGRQRALSYINREAPIIHIISNNQLFFSQNIKSAALPSGSMTTETDLYYLLYNQGRYYVAQSFTANCTPTQVYVIKEEEIQSIEYIPRDRTLACDPKLQVVVSTPTLGVPTNTLTPTLTISTTFLTPTSTLGTPTP